MITDPAWTRKALAGRGHAIRPCVSGNTCWGAVASPSALVCDNNPALATAEEIDGVPATADARKRVLVIGGGVAGLEAAWVAQARGHEVTLFSTSPEPGGRARLAAALPGGEGVAGVFDYQLAAARSHGVRLEPGLTATLADVRRLTPDEVILASGARMAWPEALLGEEAALSAAVPDLPRAIADLLAHPGRPQGTAVVIDEDHSAFTYGAVEWLAEHFPRVIVLTSRDTIARHENRVRRQGIFERLLGRRVEIIPFQMPDLRLSELEEGVVGHRHIVSGDRRRICEVSFLTFAAHREPRLEMLVELRRVGYAPRIIGDAFAPRTLLHATREGHAAGLAI
jgi:thioredoxin reductase